MFLGYGNPNCSSMVEFARSADCFCAFSANVTSLPAYTSLALGPILFNASQPPNQNSAYQERKAIILGVSINLTTASGADVAVGLAWGSQITTPPVTNPGLTATTPVTLVSATYPNMNPKQPAMQTFNAATVSTAATGFLPLITLPTTAITALNLETGWIPLDGGIVIPVGGWVALAASATATTSVLQYSIVWGETTK